PHDECREVLGCAGTCLGGELLEAVLQLRGLQRRIYLGVEPVMMSLGVPAGVTIPVHELAIKSGSPLSIMVGTSGSSGSRAWVATPSALTFPSWTWPNVTEVVSKPRSICPPMRSVMTLEAPL